MERKRILTTMLFSALVVYASPSLSTDSQPSTQAQASETILHLRAGQSDALEKALSTGDYDRVIITDALASQSKQQKFLAQATNRLKPQGRLELVVPNYKRGPVGRALTETLVRLQETMPNGASATTYRPSQYRAMLERNQLKVLQSSEATRTRTFANPQQLKDWLRTEWSYMQHVRPVDQATFAEVFVDHYLEHTKQQGANPIVFSEEILNIEAEKA